MHILSRSFIATACAAISIEAAAQAPEPGKKPKTHVIIDPASLPPVAGQQGVTFAKDIRPILEASCFRCHGQEKQKAGLRLDSLEAVLKGSEDGKVVIPGDSVKSLLVIATSQLDEDRQMPPRRRVIRPQAAAGGSGGPGAPSGDPPPKPLTPDQVSLVRAWIDQGAK